MTTLGFYFAGMSNEEANEIRRRLNEVAAGLGYVAGRGPTTGQGNAAAMLVAIAEGDLIVTSLYQRAKDRVELSDRLSRHADTILHDWPEGNEHWRWVIEADESEILDWAETVEAQQGGENL